MNLFLEKPIKEHKFQVSEPKSISTLEIDESQQDFYDFFESIEMMEGGPYYVNNKEFYPTNSINKEELPTYMYFEKKDIPKNTNNVGYEPSKPNEYSVTLSTLIVTSQLKKNKEQVMKLKNEVQELEFLERFIKTENECIIEKSIRVMDKNDSLKDENEQLKKENSLLSKHKYMWFKQMKKMILQN
jgi:hypothetical protein